MAPGTLIALDVLASLGGLVLAAFFARAWRRAGDGALLLVACGFLLLALSYPVISISYSDPDLDVDAWDALRLVGQSGAALCLVLAYASHAPRAHPLRAIAVALSAGALGVLAAAWAVRAPDGSVPLRPLLLGANVLQVVGLGACAMGASAGWKGSPRLDRALPPAGFAALALGKVLWIAHTLSQAGELVPLVYAARFGGLGALLLAVALPARVWRPTGRVEGPA